MLTKPATLSCTFSQLGIESFVFPKDMAVQVSSVEVASSQRRGGKPLRPRRPLSAMVRWMTWYCHCTDVHGFKYLALSHQNWMERALWAALLTAGGIVSLYLVHTAWEGYLSTPVLIAVETSQYPIWKIPFPAVTLCSLNKVEFSAAKNLIEGWRLPPNATREQLLADMHAVPLLSNPPTVQDVLLESLQRLQAALDLNEVTPSDLILKVAPRCENLLHRCRFKGRLRPCGELFVAMRSREGVCCAFNYYGARGGLNDLRSLEPNWAKRGNSSSTDKDRPMRTSACGGAMGLEVLLSTRTQEYHTTMLASLGFKVMVHESRDYPGSATPTWLLSPRRTLLVSLAPQLMASTHRAKVASPGARGCWSQNERHLPLLRDYTLHNCATECRRNLSAALCGCVPVHYPRKEYERPCNLLDIPCLGLIHGGYQERNDSKEMKAAHSKNSVDHVILEGVHGERPPCDCQPECDHVSYNADLSESDLTREVPASEEDFFEGVNNTADFSLLNVFFVDLVGTRYRRDTYYTWRQLLASVGGLLSLVLGVSFVSGFEVVYFFTLRVVCHLACVSRRHHRHRLHHHHHHSVAPVGAPAVLSPHAPALAHATRPGRSQLRGRVISSNAAAAAAVAPLTSPKDIFDKPWPP